MLVAHLLILAPDIGDLAQVERQPQAVECRAPQLALGERLAEHGQRVGLLGRIAGTLIGDVGRSGSALHQEGLFARAGRADLEDGFGESQPIGAVFRGGRCDLAEDLQSAAEIIAPEGRIRVGAQGRGRLVDRARLALDLRLQLDRGIGEIVTLEGLVRGPGAHQAKRQRGANRGGTNQSDHDGAPERPAVERRVEVRKCAKR